MVERFLRYSLERGRPIRVMLISAGAVRRVVIKVTEITGDGGFCYTTSRRKTPARAALCDILAASYARGDEGDTLAHELAGDAD